MLFTADVYQLLIDEIRADRRGNSIEPGEFNRLLRMVNKELYVDYVSLFEGDIESSDTMGWFKEYNTSIPLIGGVGALPDNYYQLIGKPRTLDGSTLRRVDLVSAYEDACRDDDYLTQATVTHPTCVIGDRDVNDDLQISVKPTTITNVWIDYLRVVTTPYLDYYVNDLTLEVTFLPESAVNQTVPLGSTYRDGTAGPVSVPSLTVDLEWDDEDLPMIMAKLRQKVGIQLPDQVLIETGNADEQKLKA